MSKEIFLKSYKEKVNRNYDQLDYYFNDRLAILSALNPVKYQIINCLMIEQNIASVTLTNHLLERMLKLALIEKEIYGLKIGKDDIELKLKLDFSYKKYDNLVLSQSIKEAYKSELINDKEKEYLYNIVRDNIRNAFSHAEMEKINKGKQESITMFSYKFGEVEEKFRNQEALAHKEIIVSTKVPVLQSEIQNDKCSQIAMPYFESIYKIAKNIDARLDLKKEFL